MIQMIFMLEKRLKKWGNNNNKENNNKAVINIAIKIRYIDIKFWMVTTKKVKKSVQIKHSPCVDSSFFLAVSVRLWLKEMGIWLLDFIQEPFIIHI